MQYLSEMSPKSRHAFRVLLTHDEAILIRENEDGEPVSVLTVRSQRDLVYVPGQLPGNKRFSSRRMQNFDRDGGWDDGSRFSL